MELPCITEGNDILWHGVLRETVITKGYEIRFFRNEVSSTVFIDKAHRNHVVAFTEQAFRDVIAAWRILVVGVTYLLTVQIGNVLVEERTQQQTGRFTSMSFVDSDVLTEPDGAIAAPAPSVLIDGRPVGVLIRRKGVIMYIVLIVE